VSDEKADDVREAAQSAAARARELHERGERLSADKSSTDDDLARAREALTEAQGRAAAAHRRGAARYLEAAERHEHTADLLDAGGEHERAREHRRAAAEDREEAEKAERAAIEDGEPEP
jgi:hypothetical protein